MSHAMYGWKTERARTTASRSMVMYACHGFSETVLADVDVSRRWVKGIVHARSDVLDVLYVRSM